jgi:hypothetical protein
MPEDEPIVATPAVPEVQVPPPASVRETESPGQTLPSPETDEGNGLTVIPAVVLQPVTGRVYVTVAVPEAMPDTIPEAEPIEAVPEGLAAHVPPPASLRVIDDPEHTEVAPDIAEGIGFTVSVVIT